MLQVFIFLHFFKDIWMLHWHYRILTLFTSYVAFDEIFVLAVVLLFNCMYFCVMSFVFLCYSCGKRFKREEIEAWCHRSSQWTYSRHIYLLWTNSWAGSGAHSSQVCFPWNYYKDKLFIFGHLKVLVLKYLYMLLKSQIVLWLWKACMEIFTYL